MKPSRILILIIVPLLGLALISSLFFLLDSSPSSALAALHQSSVKADASSPFQPLVVTSRSDASLLGLDGLAARSSSSEDQRSASDLLLDTGLPLPKAQSARAGGLDGIPGRIIQDWSGVEVMPAPIHNFEGISNRDNVQPPDTEGDIGYDPATGKKYYMQWVNLSLAIWDVTDPANILLELGPVHGNILFVGFGGPCETTNSGDPIVLFDHLAQRWMASQFALPNYPNGPFYQCVALSQTADPTGSWNRYQFEWPGGKFNDYPKFGVWDDGYYLSVNQFIHLGGKNYAWSGAGVAVLERSVMLAGNPARMVYFDLYGVDANFGGLLPADLDGNTPPPGTPNYFAEWDNSTIFGDSQDTLRIWEFIVDWTAPENSTFGLNGLPNAAIATADVDPDMCGFARSCIPQPGTSNKLDAIADRLMYRLQFRDFGGYQSVLSNHTVDVDGSDHAGIHWFELRKIGGNWVLYQEGVYAPDADHRWMGSLAMDHDGDIALGFSVASSSTFPSIRYAGRLASDSPGILPRSETTLIDGTGSQTAFSNRWGDYSMLGVDPLDDCTFWYTQEYYQVNGSNWQTRIASFKFPYCAIGPTGTLQGVVSDASTEMPLEGVKITAVASITQTATIYSDPTGFYQLPLPVGTYNVTASIYGYTPGLASNVAVISGTTATQNFSLFPAATYQVEGTVIDAIQGWPLYARINVQGYPGEPLWTDPVSGHYSLTLAEGITYSINAEAWPSGYLPASLQVGPLANDQIVDFALQADAVACATPGYQEVYVYQEDFESDDGGYTHSGSIDEWEWGIPSDWPGRCTSGMRCWGTDLNGNYENNSSQTLLSPVIDLSAAPVPLIAKWEQAWYIERDRSDHAMAEVSFNGGPWEPIWSHSGGTIQVDWTPIAFDVSPAAGGTLQFRFRLTSDLSINYSGYYIDDLKIASDCTPQSGGMVVGNVYDDNTRLPLVGARIFNDSDQEAFTLITSDDPKLEDGFYALFSPAGTHPFTATLSGGYASAVQNLAVRLGETLRHDFFLPAASFVSQPDSISVTLAMDTSQTINLLLTNQGAVAGTFELIEWDGGYEPSAAPAAPANVLLMGDDVGPTGWDAYRTALTAAGKTWDEWNLDNLPFPTAADLAPYQDLIWFDESILTPGDAECQIVATWLESGDKGFFAAGIDFLWDLQDGTPGQGEHNLYTLLNTHYLGRYAGSSLTELHGVAGDPIGGDFTPPDSIALAGTSDNNGNFADETVGALTGLRYGPGSYGSGHASLTHYEGTNYRTVWLGVNFHNGLISQDHRNVLMTNILEYLGARRDIPWLAADPVNGTLEAGAAQNLTLIIDAGVPEVVLPGVYTATLRIQNDTPYGSLVLPVRMTVSPLTTLSEIYLPILLSK